MNCQKCGANIDYDSLYCDQCGTKISKMQTLPLLYCNNCDSLNRLSAKYCKKCGKPKLTKNKPATKKELLDIIIEVNKD